MSNNAANADVLAAMSTAWDGANYAAAFPGGFWSGRVVAQNASGTLTPMPYVVAKSTKGQDPTYMAYIGDGSDSYIDVRRVSIMVYGVGEDNVGLLMERVKALFDRKKFAMPHTQVRLMACLSVGETTLEPDPVAKDGQDVWCGTVEFEVTTSRAVAS